LANCLCTETIFGRPDRVKQNPASAEDRAFAGNMDDIAENSPSCNAADNPIDRVVEIERLAALDPIDYEVARPEAAERLGMRVAILDNEVKKKRRALGLEESDDPGQGRAVKIQDVPPWHDPIEGDHVASALAATVKRYAVLSDIAADAIALWVLQTWLVNKFTISPRLAITSPTKGCGKTTVLRFLNQVVRRPKRAGSISPPALFRVVEQHQPTLLLDETEKYVEHGSDLHALMNEGHCKGGTILRVLGDKLELREFSIFGALAFVRNGPLPDDLEQRSIIIQMQRRLPGEELTELRDDRCESLRNLARMCARWADDYAADLDGYDPDMGGLINRDADNWRPLFAIADLVGSDWPGRARDAALALTPKDSESIGPMLLGDIKTTFDGRSVDRLSSAEICTALCEMEGKPWADWKGKSLTTNQLARLLKPFGIVTNTTVRVGAKTAKGYYRDEFQAAWQRYLTHEGAQGVYKRSQGNNADEMGTSCTFQKVTDEPDVTFQKREKPASNGPCYLVTDQNGDKAPPRACAQCGGSDGEVRLVGIAGIELHLHRGCEDAWEAGELPPILDRRGEMRS
jgi:putative DNA primase/helicase